MKCKFRSYKKDWKRNTWAEFNCGKCLPCRIRRQSQWCLRLQLEALKASSASYWTLTLKEDCLMAASEDTRRATIRKFYDALRHAEARAGNTLPIRYYGCLEFGGQYARPHWHMLIFNLLACYRDPPPYRRGLPRPHQHIAQWPHGGVDVGEFNLATVNYVCDYVTDFRKDEPCLRPVPYRTIRPAIGFYGLQHVVQANMKEHSILSEKPAFFEFGGRNWPIDQWTRDWYVKLWLDAGGIYRPIKTPSYRYKLKILEEQAILQATPRLAARRIEQREERLYRGLQLSQAKKEARQAEVAERYARIQETKAR